MYFLTNYKITIIFIVIETFIDLLIHNFIFTPVLILTPIFT